MAEVDHKQLFFRLLAITLRAALIVALIAGAWFAYKKLPRGVNSEAMANNATAVDIILRVPSDLQVSQLDIPVEFSPVDIVAVRHEFNMEPRSGKRFDDFLKERKNGRASVTLTLGKDGHGSAVVPAGDWWVHAVTSGEEALEWRLHVTITGNKQTIELTPENVYTRSRSF